MYVKSNFKKKKASVVFFLTTEASVSFLYSVVYAVLSSA